MFYILEPIEYSFGQVVERSLHLEQNTQAWCNSCDKYQPHVRHIHKHTESGG